MHNKLVEILEELNIPIGFQKFEGEAEEYIIFNILIFMMMQIVIFLITKIYQKPIIFVLIIGQQRNQS